MSAGKAGSWKQVREILDAALDQDPEHRRQYVEGACDDPDLQRQVLSVLSAYESETAEFPPPPVYRDDTEEAAPEPELYGPGAVIGPYTIARKIGAGGMGAVFLASRSDASYDQKVAIKVVQRPWASPEELRRFRSERQILADLSHPSIAQLLDGGNTPEGRPYLVMEYVEGIPIDAYCRKHEPSLEARLDLFRQVCAAVQFAHQNLIVHRDLKPANILVDEKGKVKLLDFGIAKVLDASDFAMTVMETRPGSSPMTLAYASPEQVQGQNVTTATDVYSLGLLLYEMLTGRRPYELQSFNLIDAVEAICKRDVVAPSTVLRRHEGRRAVAQKAQEEAEVARSRRGGPWRRIQGDLDAIVLKALSKEPRERYASAEQMAEDLERYRRSQPVRARQGTWTYRAWKFLVRNRMPLLALATILTILIGAIFILVRQQNEVIRQRDQAQIVSNWMIRIFESPDPRRSLGEVVTARRLLDESADSIRDDLADEPQVLSRMLQVLARTYLNLGLTDDAEPLAADAYGLASPSVDPVEVFQLLALQTKIAFRQRQYQKAVELADQGLAMPDSVTETVPEAKVELLNYKAKALMSQLDTQAAEATLAEALEFVGEDGDPELRADLLISLSKAQSVRQETGKALDSARKAVELLKDELHELHPAVLSAERGLIWTAWPEIGFEETKRRLLDLADRHRRLNNEDLADQARVYQALAAICERSGKRAEAETYYREAIRLGHEEWGEFHPDLSTMAQNLGKLRLAAGDLEEAEVLQRKALRIAEKEFGRDSYSYGIALQLQGNIEAQRGDGEASEASYRGALERLEASVGPFHDHTVQVITGLAFLRLQEERREEAEAYFREALERGLKAPERSAGMSRIQYYLARQEGHFEKWASAVEHLQEVIDVDGTSGLGPRAAARRSRFLISLERFEEAEKDALWAEEIFRPQGSEPWVLHCRHSLGLAYLGQGRAEEAVDVLQQVHDRRVEMGVSADGMEEIKRDLARAREALL